ncbi:MAG: MerR family DNA-binding transcriptional regulator [Sphingobium sp.]
MAKAASPSFSIAELSNEFGITARALRFYEDEGLLAPWREGASRRYSIRDRIRLGWILRGKRVGFSLAEIREMIEAQERADDPAAQRNITIQRCRARIDRLQNQKMEIEQALGELGAFVAGLAVARRVAG